MSINANNHDVHPYSPACRMTTTHFPFHLLLSAALHIELSTWTRTVITMVVIMMTLPCHLDIKDIDVDNMMKNTTTMLIMTVVIMN